MLFKLCGLTIQPGRSNLWEMAATIMAKGRAVSAGERFPDGCSTSLESSTAVDREGSDWRSLCPMGMA